MGHVNTVLFAFNRGLISKLALARADLKRAALSAQQQDNWMPRKVGSMMLRPGWAYLGATKNNAAAKHIQFVKATTDTAILQLTDSVMRVLVGDVAIARVSVGTAIANGTFTTDLASWTGADQTGAVSAWAVGGFMSLVGDGFNAAIRKQTVTVAGGDQNKEHALRIIVNRGPVTLRVGSVDEGQDYIAETDLNTGTHSLAFTPTGNFFIKFSAIRKAASLLDSIAVEAAGILELPTPWTVSQLVPNTLRWAQSADVVFVACDGLQQRRIERRSTRSWSVALYVTEDGPFRIQNFGPAILTPSALNGDITLTSSVSIFHSNQVGALWSLTSTGQDVTAGCSAANVFSNPIKVTGVTTNTTAVLDPTATTTRKFQFIISGTWVGTVTIQRSLSAPGAWVDVLSYTTNQNHTYDDALSNEIAYYRIGIKAAQYTSGTANVELRYSGGNLTGIMRVTAFTDEKTVSAAVITDLGGTTGSAIWAEGQWSDFRGWPTSVAFYEGRLWWSGRNAISGSVSDAYASFDETIEGDSGPILRTIGSGPVDVINFLAPLQRLILGAQGAEISARSSSFDEPLTPVAFSLKDCSTQGSYGAPAVKMDTSCFFIQRSQTKIFRLTYNFTFGPIDYTASDTTAIIPELGYVNGVPSGFTMLAIQRQPDTRIHALRADGVVAVLVFDEAEDVQAWVTVSTSGIVEDMFVLPGTTEDQVYYLVNRTVNGATVRYLEKWAREDECQGGTTSKQIDSHLVYSGAPTTTLTAAHLAAASLVVWADGKDQGIYTADGSGNITLPNTVSNAVYGLSYTAKFQSAKLDQVATRLGTALTQRKKIAHLGLVLDTTHYQGLQYGRDFSSLFNLPLVEDGAVTADDLIWTSYDKDSFEFEGEWNTDARVCLQAASPRPVTVLAAVIGMEVSEK